MAIKVKQLQKKTKIKCVYIDKLQNTYFFLYFSNLFFIQILFCYSLSCKVLSSLLYCIVSLFDLSAKNDANFRSLIYYLPLLFIVNYLTSQLFLKELSKGLDYVKNKNTQ